jgi:hypothetical protein
MTPFTISNSRLSKSDIIYLFSPYAQRRKRPQVKDGTLKMTLDSLRVAFREIFQYHDILCFGCFFIVIRHKKFVIEEWPNTDSCTETHMSHSTLGVQRLTGIGRRSFTRAELCGPWDRQHALEGCNNCLLHEFPRVWIARKPWVGI